MSMTLSEELQWRGFVNQTTFEHLTDLDSDQRNFYFGVDPSAPSMTIGNLASAMMVRHFIAHGNNAYLLVGGATGLIGDPDGKKQERDLLSFEQLEANKQAIAGEYSRVFDGMDFTLVDNYDWFQSIHYLTFLRDIGKHLSMTQLLDREFVKSRIGVGGSGISYAEFSYSLIQGYDFLHLYREHDVTLQLCGADQWGNSLTGVEMIRKFEGKTAHVYSTPLIINQATGQKFGKSEAGAVWLDENLTSAFAFYQFWLNVDDQGVSDYIKVYTLISPDEYEALMAEFNQAPHQRAAQKYLALEATKIVHGHDRAEQVEKLSQVLFGDVDFTELSEADIKQLTQEFPTIETENLITALIEGGLAVSKSEARRFVESGAVSVNGAKVESPEQLPVFHNGYALIKRGKNSFALLRG